MPRLALILRGLGFRQGGYGSRTHGSTDSYQEQIAACKSHVELCQKIEQQGYRVDIFLDTYSTKYNTELLELYKPYITQYRFHQTPMPHQQHMIHDCVSLFNNSHALYDRFLLLRFDVLVKPEFIQAYDPSMDKVVFLCICWWKDRKTESGKPRINDTIHHIPQRLFPILSIFGSVFCEHHFLHHIPLEYGKDYDLLTKAYYDSNTEHDKNPYCRIVGRPESEIWHSPQKQFPEDFD